MGGRKAHAAAREWYWEKDDPLGVWKGLDWPAIRRGRQVYTEVFAPCHSIQNLTFNHFQTFMTKEEIKALAATYDIIDTNPDKEGNMVPRPGKPTDDLPAPYPNQNAAAFANNSAAPPDLRTMLFAREGQANYIFSLMTGYGWDGDLMAVPHFAADRKTGQFFNPYFKNCVLSMPPPLSDGMLEYDDGTPATVSQMAKDVTSFLRWTLEPEYDERRVYYWKTVSTMFLLTAAFTHHSIKNWSWRIYKRINFRYWKRPW